jgi:formate-dependent nitrite reductase membrane component NrfD
LATVTTRIGATTGAGVGERGAWASAGGVLLVIGVVFAGILLLLVLHAYPRLLGALSAPASATLVLVGGFLLRVVVVLSSQRL